MDMKEVSKQYLIISDQISSFNSYQSYKMIHYTILSLKIKIM